MRRVILTAALILSAASANAFYEIGEEIQDFTLLDPQGNEISLFDFSGDVILLNVFATW